MFFKIPYPPAASNPNGRIRRREYREQIQDLLNNAEPLSGDVYVAAKFFPKNFYLHRGDLDNLMKTLLDAIKGKCFYDDSQIRALYAVMMDSDLENPRVEIRVEHHNNSEKQRNENN